MEKNYQFLGEHECKVDPKGRLRLPSSLLRQLGDEEKELKFVVNRGIEKCLVMYPYPEWEKITSELSKLNQYVEKNRKFIRFFHRGATELIPDTNDRVNLPNRLMEYAGIENELVILAYFNKIELWSVEEYEKLISEEPDDFSDLAEEVMGGGVNIDE